MGKRARRKERETAALRARRWVPVLSAREQAELDRLVMAIGEHGFTVSFVEWCEDAETPGFLGRLAGVTDPQHKRVKIRTRDMNPAQVIAITSHELEHVLGAEYATDHLHLGLRCGGRVNGFGNPVSAARA